MHSFDCVSLDAAWSYTNVDDYSGTVSAWLTTVIQLNMWIQIDVNRKNIKIDRWHDILGKFGRFTHGINTKHDCNDGQIQIEIIRIELRCTADHTWLQSILVYNKHWNASFEWKKKHRTRLMFFHFSSLWCPIRIERILRHRGSKSNVQMMM